MSSETGGKHGCPARHFPPTFLDNKVKTSVAKIPLRVVGTMHAKRAPNVEGTRYHPTGTYNRIAKNELRHGRLPSFHCKRMPLQVGARAAARVMGIHQINQISCCGGLVPSSSLEWRQGLRSKHEAAQQKSCFFFLLQKQRVGGHERKCNTFTPHIFCARLKAKEAKIVIQMSDFWGQFNPSLPRTTHSIKKMHPLFINVPVSETIHVVVGLEGQEWE